MTDYAAYARQLRQELHQYPEIGFDLPKTLAVVKRELDAMGIAYTEKYGRSSVVATINEEKDHFTIGFRADMDALPIQEADDGRACRSLHDGKMHACGHDVHTANLLAVARRLKDMQEQIHCRIKLLFTPAEEYITPGCKEMAEDGVMDDIDCIVACHCDSMFDVGTVAVDAGGQGANSMGFTVDFYGTSAHAHQQHRGKDAIAMAVQAYAAMELMVAKEFNPVDPVLLNIGAIRGGQTNNVICDHCWMFGSARTQTDENSEKLIHRIREVCQRIAALQGGRAEVKVTKFLPFVINDATVTGKVRAAAEKVVGRDKIFCKPRSMGGEDFSFLCRKKPGMIFRLGTKGQDPATHLPLHNGGINFDEGCFQVANDIFVQFVLDNMDGIAL